MSDKQTEPQQQLKKSNIRLALVLGALAIGVMVYTMASLIDNF